MLPKRVLGQHFLKNPSLLEKLTRLSGITGNDTIVEIGTGRGDLTRCLTEKGKFVFTCEIDKELVEDLKIRFASVKNLKIIHANFLKLNFAELYKLSGQKLKVVANIPYRITTPLLLKFIDEIDYISDCNILIQKEVAERLIARPGTKQYSALTVMLQAYFNIKILKYISRSSFSPPPEVDSAFIKLTPLATPLVEKSMSKNFSRLLKVCFSKRRKTIYNILKGLYSGEDQEINRILECGGIHSRARPENLTVLNFAFLSGRVKFP